MNIVKDDEEKRNLLTQAKNNEELTPFQIATNNKNAPICQVLKDSGDANANGASGACIIAWVNEWVVVVSTEWVVVVSTDEWVVVVSTECINWFLCN